MRLHDFSVFISKNIFARLCLLLISFQAAQLDAIEYKGHEIEAIDLHMHPGTYEGLGPIGKKYLHDTLPRFLPSFLKDWSLSLVSHFQLNPYGSVIGIKSECMRAGMSMCGLFAVHAPETWGIVTNDQIVSYLDDPRNVDNFGNSYFFGLATIEMKPWPRVEKDQIRKLRKYLSHPLVKGIKLAFIHNGVPLDDPQYDSVYLVAREFKVPVYHHVGTSPLRKLSQFENRESAENYAKSYNPKLLERAIKRYPDVPFILGHVGFDFNDEGQSSVETVLNLASRYENAYIEISAFGDPIHDKTGHHMVEVLRKIKKKGLIEKTLYGSDGPTIPGGAQSYLMNTLSAMSELDFSPSEVRAILSENTKQLFNLFF